LLDIESIQLKHSISEELEQKILMYMKEAKILNLLNQKGS